jgi:hypothetical protein
MNTRLINAQAAPVMYPPSHDARRDDTQSIVDTAADGATDLTIDSLGNLMARGSTDKHAAASCQNAGDGEGLLDGIGESLANAAGTVAGAATDAAGAVFENLLDGL